MMLLFFFMQKTAYEMRISDVSSDVCSSDLPQPKNPADPVECLDRRVALACFDALERQRAQPAMVCELFLSQAADLAHAFDGLPEVPAAGIEVGVELVAQRTRVFEVTAPAWTGQHGKIGRAHVCTPDTHAHIVCSLLQ